MLDVVRETSQNLPETVAALDAAPLPTHQMARLSLHYFLDSARNLTDAFGGDLMMGLIFLAIIDANVAHITLDPESARLYGGPDLAPPDSERRPVTVYQIAKNLGLTYETTRRYVKRLAEAGHCRRDAEGCVVTLAMMQTPAIRRCADRNRQAFRDLINRAALAGLA